MGNFIDLTGKRFGNWLVLRRDEENLKKNIHWICQCDCGTIRSVSGTSLRSGISFSCGCLKDKKTSERTKTAVDDLVGKRFGSWTVLELDLSNDKSSKRGARWICRCDCGTTRSVLGYAMKYGRSQSCGCNHSSSIKDLTGQKFGRLTVLELDSSQYDDNRGARWICQCDCGNIVSVLSGRLVSGQTRSCGCSRSNIYRANDISIGDRFNYWTVVKKDLTKKGKGSFYICKCICGNERSIPAYTLKQGFSQSCGCKRSIPQKDLTGQKFGELTVLEQDLDYFGSGIYWRCKCSCGSIKSYRTLHLEKGKVKSCGCLSRKMTSERRFDDITGQRFGKLIAIKVDHVKKDNNGNNNIFWLCHCDCGNDKVVQGDVLRRGETVSCGCYQAQQSSIRAAERTVDLLGRRFGKLTVIERSIRKDNYGHTIGTWLCQCDCGNTTFTDGYYLWQGMVTSCGCANQSKYEMYVLQYFREKEYMNSVDYECQKRFDDLRGYDNGMLSFDFAVYKSNKLLYLIECQGQQHYMPVEMFGGKEQFAKQQIHDELKRNYAKKLKVHLLEIPYTVKTYEDAKQILETAGV